MVDIEKLLNIRSKTSHMHEICYGRRHRWTNNNNNNNNNNNEKKKKEKKKKRKNDNNNNDDDDDNDKQFWVKFVAETD